MKIITDKLLQSLFNEYEKDPITAYARALCAFALSGASGTKNALSRLDSSIKVSRSTLDSIYLEYLGLYLHLTNRSAYVIYGEVAMNQIQQAVFPQVMQLAAEDVSITKPANFLETFQSIINSAESTYADTQYWIAPIEVDSTIALHDPNSTLVMFYRRIARVLQLDFDSAMDHIKITASASGTVEFNNLIEISEWLKGVAIRLGISTDTSIDLTPPISKKS